MDKSTNIDYFCGLNIKNIPFQAKKQKITSSIIRWLPTSVIMIYFVLAKIAVKIYVAKIHIDLGMIVIYAIHVMNPEKKKIVTITISTNTDIGQI